jgi:anti-sigma factor RsiW
VTTRHLGKRLYALVDGRLSREGAYVAMAHVGECEECAARWQALRKDRIALQTSGTGIDMSFTSHLLDRSRIAEIARDEPRRHVRAAHGRGVNVAAVGISAFAGGALVLGILWNLGAPPEVGLEVAAPPDRSTAASVQLMGAPRMRVEGSLISWVHPSWESTDVIPVDAALIQMADGTTVLVASVLAGGEPIRVIEQRGTLPSGFGAGLPKGTATDREVYIVSEDPSQIVWDAGGVVVSLDCTCSVEVLESVATEFPHGHEPGILERLGDGLGVVADAVAGG